MSRIPIDSDDAALWAAIDTAAASSAAFNSPPPSATISRFTGRALSPINTHFPTGYNLNSPVIDSPISPFLDEDDAVDRLGDEDENEGLTHCLSGVYPNVSLFKEIQDAAIYILEQSDYAMISGTRVLKKSCWRKIALYFNVSFEIKDRDIVFDDNRNVLRAQVLVRACMQGGRFCDAFGTCDHWEKRFLKPNNDIPSTAETRAKTRACQDLLGIVQYRAGASPDQPLSPQ